MQDAHNGLNSKLSYIPAVTNTAAIVLGAGLSQRYGQGDKLSALLAGKPVSHHVLKTLERFSFRQRVLVCRLQAWSNAFVEKGYQLVNNGDPELGISHSIELAMEYVSTDMNVLICLADMPLLPESHIERLYLAFLQEQSDVVTIGTAYRGPPALFMPGHLHKRNLRGDQGARRLLEHACQVSLNDQYLQDVDTREDLAHAHVTLGWD